MYVSPIKPRKHQITALSKLREHPDAFALLMEMGTGKTKVILDEWGDRVDRGELDDLLVLAPAGAYDNWCRVDDEDPGEIQKHLPADLRKKITVAKWQSSKKKQAFNILKAKHPRVLVMNIEALSSVSDARDLCDKFLSGGRTMMVIDESTAIKSPKARRTKAVLHLGNLADARRIATGMVAPRSPLDIYTQFEFLDWSILGFKSFYAFRARYAVMKKMMFGGRAVQMVVGYRNMDELHQKIAPYSYRVLKEDCLDLEPKTYESRDVPLSQEQLRMYVELKKNATTQLGESYVTATAVITQILRLHQLLCGHIVDELGNIVHVPERRTDELVALLEEHSGKAIIWTAYGESLNKISARLRKEFGPDSVAEFWGGNRATRDQDERRFKTDPKCRFMVATPQAGGKGNTWTVANLVVYYSNTYDLEARAQSEDRAHRDGQEHKVTYVDLVARGTVDEKIIHALRKKIDMASIISGDNYRDWLI